MQDTKQVTTIDEMLQEYLKKNEIKKLKPRQASGHRSDKLPNLKRDKKKLRSKLFKNKTIASRLNAEQLWFYETYKKYLSHPQDHFLRKFNHYFPEVINHRFKYIIEIDNFRTTPNDKKAQYYKAKSYRWFKIEAYNNKHMQDLIRFLFKIRTIDNDVPK